MARPLRIEYPGACYHVLNRGNQRQVVFREDRDYRLFLEKLVLFAETFDVEVRSYCLMPNHFHLYVCTREANLSRFMQSLLTSFTIVMNRRHRSSGHLFQGRFKAWLIEDEAYGSRLSRYIHLNPIRVAGAVEREPADLRQELRAFPWSSYGAVIGLRSCPRWLKRGPVLCRWGTGVREQQRQYSEYVEGGLLRNARDSLEAEAIRGIIGSEAFIDRIRRLVAQAADSVDRRECGQLRALAASHSLERVIQVVCARYGEKSDDILRPYYKSSEARQILLYLASTMCRGRYPLTTLAEQLGPISIGALTRARDKMQKQITTDRQVRRRIERLVAAVTSETP